MLMRNRETAVLNYSKSLLAMALAGVVVWAQEPAANRILRPTEGSSLPNGKIEGIAKVAKSGAVFIDGIPVATKQNAPGVLTFSINTPNGSHTLELKYDGGSEKLTFTSGKSEHPFSIHPPAASCETCHAIKESTWAFKNDILEKTCSGCHNLKEFAKTHQHNLEQLADCALCHNPHGSSEAFHMKYLRKVACKQCHG